MDSIFKAKHDRWSDALNSKDPNAIFQQLNWLSIDTGLFRVINEARKYSTSDEDGGVKNNSLLHGRLNRWFYTHYAISVRRLTAKESMTGTYGTYSLRALVDDMKSNVCLLTRENLLAIDGFPMDLEPIRRAEEEYQLRQHEAGLSAWQTPVDLDTYEMNRRHSAIDLLCGVSSVERKPSDQVNSAIFDSMAGRMDQVAREIEVWVNKFVAHAATPESRQHEDADKVRVTLGHFWRAIEALCRVAMTLNLHFVGRATSHVHPLFAYDEFRYIERPLVPKKHLAEVKTLWNSFRRETETWAEGNLSWLMGTEPAPPEPRSDQMEGEGFDEMKKGTFCFSRAPFRGGQTRGH